MEVEPEEVAAAQAVELAQQGLDFGVDRSKSDLTPRPASCP
jgi:hypothetical protein